MFNTARNAHSVLKINLRQLGLAMLLVVIAACQSLENNETSYRYTFAEETFENAGVKRIIIAHQNLGIPSRKYLQPYSGKIDTAVAQRLETGGFEVIRNEPFKSLWRGAVRKHGQPFNEFNGRANLKALEAILYEVLTEVKTRDLADAVLFTDLIEREVNILGRNQRVAKWDGVSRAPRVQTGDGKLSADFDWNQKISAASVLLILYGNDGQHLFKGAGGLALTRDIDPRGNGRFVRRKNLFGNSQQVAQGVAIALHPLVPLEGYIDYPATSEQR